MVDLSMQIGNLRLVNPVLLAAGPLTTEMSNLIEAEQVGVGAVDTKVSTLRKYPRIKCFERTFWSPDTKTLNWMLGPWDGEYMYIDDAVEFIKAAKRRLSIPVFGNFKEDSDRTEQWITLAKRLEDAGADALVTFFTFIHDFVGKEIEMAERILGPVCSAVRIPVIFKLQPDAGLSPRISDMVRIMEDVGLSAIQIADGIGGYPILRVDRPPYHPFDCIDFQARDGFISGAYLKPLVYKTVYEYFRETRLPIICSGGIWDAQSAIEAILYGASVIASASGPCIKGWEMFDEIVQGIRSYMREQHFTSVQEFRGLAGQYIRENHQIDYPNCYAVVDESKCSGCENCLPPAHCNAIRMQDGLANIDRELCMGCCICKYLCPTGAIEVKVG